MKITIVQGAFLPVPPLLGGAVEKIHQALGKEFTRRGCSVTHVSRRYPGLPNRETADGVEHRRVAGFDSPRSLAVLKLLDLFYSLRVLRVLPKADIIVTNTFWLPILLRTRKHGAVYVNVNRYPKGQMRFYRHAARLQAVSQVVADAITAQTPAVREKVRVIANPLPDSWCDPAPDLSQPRRREILYVGRIHPEKGIALLLDAFARVAHDALQGWRLVIVGPAEAKMGGGGADYLARLKQQAAPVKECVDWIGPVFDNSELKSYYDRASFFAYPSLAAQGESFGLSTLEAMARGCIPAVSDLACFRDYLTPGHNGFVFNHEASDPVGALAERLSECVRFEDGLLPIRRNGLVTAQRFTPVKIADQFLEDFRHICASKQIGNTSVLNYPQETL